MRSRGPLVVVAGSLLVLTGCGDRGSGSDAGEAPSGSSGSSGPEVVLECPEVLAQDDGVPEPAAAALELPALDAAVVCTYDSTSSPDGTWTRRGEAADVPQEVLGGLDTVLAGLEPAPSDQMCTLEMGPRVLLVGATSEGPLNVVVEDYGCGDLLLTPDPATVPPGVGGSDLAEPGTFAGGRALLEQLGGLTG